MVNYNFKSRKTDNLGQVRRSISHENKMIDGMKPKGYIHGILSGILEWQYVINPNWWVITTDTRRLRTSTLTLIEVFNGAVRTTTVSIYKITVITLKFKKNPISAYLITVDCACIHEEPITTKEKVGLWIVRKVLNSGSSCIDKDWSVWK